MHDFGVMLKSYAPDFEYAKRFIESFREFASEDIPLYVVVPELDVQLFKELVGSTGEVLPESLWAEHLVDYPIHGNSPGYINQEIIKLAFAEKGLVANYLCADSEAVFIRPFSRVDFMADQTTPFTFVSEDHELQLDPIYFQRYGKARHKSLRELRQYFDLPLDNYSTCHNMAVFSALVLQDLRHYMESQDLSYADLIEISPYEFSWYNFWLEKSKVIPRITREPIFEIIHMDHHYLRYALKQISLADLARGYVGIVIKADGVVDLQALNFQTRYIDTIAENLVSTQIVSAIVEKLLQRAPRVRRALKALTHK